MTRIATAALRIAAFARARGGLGLMLACLLVGLAWLFPMRLPHRVPDPTSGSGQIPALQAFYFDNDIRAIINAAPKVTMRQAAAWFYTGNWLDLKGGGPFWRPLVSCLWWLEYRWWGRDIASYSLVTLALIALACALLAGAVAVYARSLLAGAAAAGFLLWKVSDQMRHMLYWFPAQTNLLAGVSVAAALYLLVIATQASGKRNAPLAASLACYVLAVLSKEAALAFPLAAVALLWARLGWRRGASWMGAYVVTGLLLFAARTLILGGAGHFLVSFEPAHLLRRVMVVLAGPWLGASPGWEAAGSALLAAAVIFAALRPDLVRRRLVGYSMVPALLALLALAARLINGSAVILWEPAIWPRLVRPLPFLLCGALAIRRRPAAALVFACLVVANSVELMLVRDWVRAHYYYLPAMAWAAMDGLVVAAAVEAGLPLLRQAMRGARTADRASGLAGGGTDG